MQIHFRGYPSNVLIPCEGEDSVKWSFVNSLKEVCQNYLFDIVVQAYSILPHFDVLQRFTSPFGTMIITIFDVKLSSEGYRIA